MSSNVNYDRWLQMGTFSSTWARKFFIMHEDSITGHSDHMKTSKIDEVVKLDGGVELEERSGCAIAIKNSAGKDLLVIRMEDDDERELWFKALRRGLSYGQEQRASAMYDPNESVLKVCTDMLLC